jgi:multidrug resistance efflux pump
VKPGTFRARIGRWKKGVFSWFANHPVVSVCGALFLTYALFELGTQVFVFCRDAYVTTDIVFVAPEVSGPVATLPVTDNQKIEMGAILFTIDREPFEIALEREQSTLELAKATLGKVRDELGLTTSEIQGSQATLEDATKTRDRILQLSKEGAVSQQTLTLSTAQNLEYPFLNSVPQRPQRDDS